MARQCVMLYHHHTVDGKARDGVTSSTALVVSPTCSTCSDEHIVSGDIKEHDEVRHCFLVTRQVSCRGQQLDVPGLTHQRRGTTNYHLIDHL